MKKDTKQNEKHEKRISKNALVLISKIETFIICEKSTYFFDHMHIWKLLKRE